MPESQACLHFRKGEGRGNLYAKVHWIEATSANIGAGACVRQRLPPRRHIKNFRQESRPPAF